MRISLLPTLTLVALALAAPAYAAQDLRSPDARDAAAAATQRQDLRSPDARDAAAAQRHLRAGGHMPSKYDAALAQEKYYSTYGKAARLHRPAAVDDGTPWDAIAAGIALILVVAAAVGIAVRTRRRVSIAV